MASTGTMAQGARLEVQSLQATLGLPEERLAVTGAAAIRALGPRAREEMKLAEARHGLEGPGSWASTRQTLGIALEERSFGAPRRPALQRDIAV